MLLSILVMHKEIFNALKIDGQLSVRVAASVVKDSKTGDTYLKVVNALPSSLNLDVNGLPFGQQTVVEGFYAKPGDKSVAMFDADIKAEISGSKLSMPPYSVCAVKIGRQ